MSNLRRKDRQPQPTESGLQEDNSWIVDDSELLRTRISPICTFCAHWQVTTVDGSRHCAAYPVGGREIPSVIWEGYITRVFPIGGERKDLRTGRYTCFEPHPEAIEYGTLPEKIVEDLARLCGGPDEAEY